MILNLIIILFLIAMFVVWAQYGLFSSFLHCCLVIVCGAFALALWEPLTLGLLINRMPHYAWGVALLGPLALMLIFLHVIVDRLVGVSLQFPDVVNKIGGGVFGVLSGLLTAGLVVLGIGFLPLPTNVMGYQRYTITGTGQVDLKSPSRLWVPVDDIAAGFFSMLSTGAFSTHTPLATHQPQLATQAGIFRLRPDQNSSTVALPNAVSVTAMHTHPTLMPELPGFVVSALGPAFEDKSNKIVVIETTWRKEPGLFDSDSTLRVPPTQIKLVSARRQAGEVSDITLSGPLAFRGKTRTPDEQAQPYFHAVNSDSISAFGFDDTEQITFVFVIPENHQAMSLLARHTRLSLPAEPGMEGPALIAALGTPPPQVEAVASTDRPDAGQFSQGAIVGPDGVEFVLTNQIPIVVSKNAAIGLNYEDNGNAILSGEATADRATGISGGPRTRLTEIATPAHRPMIRMRINGRQAREYFGGSDASEAMRLPVFLTDDRGNEARPMAAIWLKGDSSQYFNVLGGGRTFANGGQIGVIPRIGNDEDLFLYFQVTRGTSIVSYQIAQSPLQRLDAPIRAE